MLAGERGGSPAVFCARKSAKWRVGGGMSCEECGISAMRAAAAKVLFENAPEIAAMHLAKALKGDERSLTILRDLAREHKEFSKAERKGPKRSLATEWANEPEWTEEDERAAKACGNR